ncbi:hypothetical protein A3F29_04450 [Candidatus Roizmanbacteria bacterium RIFCSPHIGHO2_12_FULL_33_9]|uniref:Uncharacterized protein n=1 Tax=Candidatus Roizmanbacteria bacterium RIFCSPHIGHO2_12_FULL_33_9 TaxID=1802045 RepID=A0A1F7HIR8_9BACT|nr:MAG: hypothetical protein A3F29_04450 [Candidatus Roizmanbacteria bacterium RIFCSPHIGHO2_12_FULL_33_9]
MQRRGPYYFITALLLILFFIVGVRYGQRVERTNKEVSVILSITPSPSPSIDISKFEKYESDLCNIEFLYPLTLQLVDSSLSADINSKEKISFNLLCDTEKEEIFFKTASPESKM